MNQKTSSLILVEELCCSAEEQLIRKKLAGMKQVGSLEFNIPARTLRVQHDLTNTAPIVNAINALGMTATEQAENAPVSRPSPAAGTSAPWWRSAEALVVAASGICALSAEIIHWSGTDENWLGIKLLAGVAVVTGAYKTAGKAWHAIRSMALTIHVLMIIAVLGAILLGEWSEAGMVMFLFAVAEIIEARSLNKARQSISSLVSTAPETVSVGHDDHWHQVPVQHVKPGDRIRVRPGERLALDGTIYAGSSELDQSPITGESLPVPRTAGDAVFAGSINCSGAFDYRATQTAANSTIERVMRTVQQATANRTRAERFIDTFARYYTPSIVGLAVLVALVPPLVMGAPWSLWLHNALYMLVIGCPCALVISTPVAIVSGLTNAARQGILVKGGSFLEMGARLKAVAFDKTGTLTEGRLNITDVLTYNGMTEEEVLHLAAAVERASEHPVASAIVAAHRRMHGVHDDADLTGFVSMSGLGASGMVDGRQIIVGNHRLAHETGVCGQELESQLAALEAQGKTAIVVMTPTTVLGVIALADTLRPVSQGVISELRQLGLHTLMLTGDNRVVAGNIAARVGITDVHWDQLPHDKMSTIDNMHHRVGLVGMIGDGINDAPALARADIGFAMTSAGAGVTMEAANVVIMNDRLEKLPEFIRLARRTVRLLTQNIVLALGIKFVFAVLPLLGLPAEIWMAVFADMGASLIVVFNSLRLLRPGGVA